MNKTFLKSIKPIYWTFNLYKYLKFQKDLAFANLRDRKNYDTPDGIPVPPALLRHRVHGGLDRDSFLEIGRNLSRDIRNLCALIGRDIYSFDHILDFGCGSGRVLRNLQDAPKTCTFYGTDIDPALTVWCKNNLKDVRVNTNGYNPPLPYPDNTFDLIYSISVFTHLDEEYQHAWLEELQRVAKPGSYLILSIHGQPCINYLVSSYQKKVNEKGILFVKSATGKLKIDKLPDFYQCTYHTPDYIKRVWSNYFDIIHHVERGINNHQDAVILQKRT
jgi:ubiquinone/menaquinone biosynthesis C-methylase UbiE